MRHSGFSLVELSIVLVILGLLTGGILAGQSLIRAAELRSISTSLERFAAAHHSFRDKYFALAGDMNNATKFWGVLAGNGSDPTCQNTEATGRETCNGNGNGRVESTDNAVPNGDERFRYWQHLANAGLIEGSYTGRTDSATPTTYVMTAGKNSPSVNGGNAKVDPFTQGPSSANYTATNYPFIDAYKGDEFTFAYRSKGGNPGGDLLLPEEQWNLDVKLDDGLAARGKLLAPKMSWSAMPNCTTSDNSATAEYNLTRRDKICRFNYTVN